MRPCRREHEITPHLPAGLGDPIGTALITAGLTAIVLPLVEGRQHGWPMWTWLALAAAPVLLVGAGMGLGITPLATLIMAGPRPEHAGATAGILASMQNVGNALGAAVLGVVFLGAVSGGFGGAF